MIQTKHQPNKSKTFISFILIAVLLITGVFAILSATSKKSNVFTSGNVSIKLHESGWSDNNDGFFNRDDNKNKNIAPGQIIPKAPYIENDGNTDAWTYIVVGIPTAESKDLYADSDGRIKLSPNLSIKMQAYAIQQDCADNAIDTWSYYTNRKSPESKWGPEKTNNENMTEVFEIIGLDDAYWTQIGDVYHSQDNYNYYIYTIANDQLLSPNTTTNVLFTDVKLNSEVGILLSNRYHLTYLDGQTYKDGDSYSVGTNIPFDKFENVIIDGNIVPTDKYEKLKNEENLTVIKFTDKEYMSDWDITIHPISASANDGDATGEFEKIDIYRSHEYNPNTHICDDCGEPEPGLYDENNNFIISYEDSGLDVERDYMTIFGSVMTTGDSMKIPWEVNEELVGEVTPDSEMWSEYLEYTPEECAIHYMVVETSGYNVINKHYPNTTKIILPNTITQIGLASLAGCPNLKEIVLSDTIKTIQANAFVNDTNVIILNIGANVASIDLQNQNSIQEYVVDIANPNYTTKDGILYSKDMTTIEQFPQPRTGTFVIPNSVETIKSGCFVGSQLSNVIIPDSVKTIEDTTFAFMPNLISLNIPDTVETIPDMMCYSSAALKTVVLGRNVKSIGWGTFFHTNIENIYIPKTLKSVSDIAFNYCPIKNTYFSGTQTDWNKISITYTQGNNYGLQKSVKHYNYVY